MQRWLSIELAKSCGVTMGVNFGFLGQCMNEIKRELDPNYKPMPSANELAPMIHLAIRRNLSDWEELRTYLKLNTHADIRLELEQRLDPDRFIRVHRSHVVNLDHVKQMKPHGDRRLEIHLVDGSMVIASRSGSQKLRELSE